MAGLYLHIPFCKKACHYCNFYFSTALSNKEQFVQNLIQEIKNKKTLIDEPISTVYFGGGTPSQLSIDNIHQIVETISKYYSLANHPEITFEANPDDISREFAINLKAIGINRVSIGIQSFIEKELKLMNRSHSSIQAISALENLLDAGFDNINADLIYGLPESTEAGLRENLRILHQLNIPHLSCYSLTVEEKTKLHRLVREKKVSMIAEETNIRQYHTLIETTRQYGFEQYELSNFAKNEKYSQHNTAYWFGKPYLGFGPSAHSYYNKRRSWNISNLISYNKGIEQHKPIQEEEALTEENIFNEYIMTRLRTKWGINTSDLDKIFSNQNHHQLKVLIEEGYIDQLTNKNYILTQEGKILADQIILRLMV
jgi:oxygen-independent coproporphyrinogen-3 oxidase